MRSIIRTASVILAVTLVLMAQNQAFAATQVPTEGMKVVYLAETTQTIQQQLGVYASSLATLLFHDVNSVSALMDSDVQSTYTQNGQTQNQNYNATVGFPTDRDTLLYLRNGGQQELSLYAGPASITLPQLPGETINLTRTWDLYDRPIIKNALGTFEGYRYHTFISSVQTQIGQVDIDVYASYDQASQLLMGAEVWAKGTGFTAMVAHTDIREWSQQATQTAQNSPRCLIATATYGSELAPPVQFLREFRDQKIQKTFAGSTFMALFNAWYYSFSPGVAGTIQSSPALKSIMQLTLFPAVAILRTSAGIFDLLAPQPEFAAFISGLAASSMLGALYLSLPAVVITRRRRANVLVVGFAVLLAGGLAGLVVAEFFGLAFLASLVSAQILLSNLLLFGLLPSWLVRRFVQ